MKRLMSSSPALAVLAVAVLLVGCASIAPDGGRSAVAEKLGQRLPVGAQLPSLDEPVRADAQHQIAQWLQKPLDADTAVRIALLNNPGLQVKFADLGIADAERVRVLTLPNPSFTLGRFSKEAEREWERQLSFGVVQLITWPWRERWQGWQMEQSTLMTAQEVLRLATDTRRAWLRAVAAKQLLQVNERMSEAASVGAELATRMGKIGNFNKLQQAREVMAQQENQAQLARAQLNAELEREQLARLMGLWGQQADVELPEQLPALPSAVEQLQASDDVEAVALRQRLDLQALRLDLDVNAARYGVAGVGAVFGDVGLTYTHSRSTDRGSAKSTGKHGWEVELPIPLFDWGAAAQGRARASMERSAALLRQTAITARSEVRSNWLRYRTAWNLARQQQTEVLPLAKLVQQETVYRYNGMFVSVWQLLAQARATMQAVTAATEAQRDFWLADADLQLVLMGTSPTGIPAAVSGRPSTATTTFTQQGH